MRNWGGHIGVAAMGVVSLLLTVVLVAQTNLSAGFNLLTWTVGILPAGAMLTGAAAASGAALGSGLFRTRPRRVVAPLALAAAFALGVIYYSEYSALLLGNGRRLADSIGFSAYLEIRLTTAHLRPVRGGDPGDPGILGYGVPVVQFAGFILGGLTTSLFRRGRPVCLSCSHELRQVVAGHQHFNDYDTFEAYYENVLELPLDGPEFADWMRYDPAGGQLREGSVLVVSTLRECPCCRSQRLDQAVRVLEKAGWRASPKRARDMDVPDGMDLRPVFYGRTGQRVRVPEAA